MGIALTIRNQIVWGLSYLASLNGQRGRTKSTECVYKLAVEDADASAAIFAKKFPSFPIDDQGQSMTNVNSLKR